MKSILIAYYSWSNGNTESIVKRLQTKVGGDLFKIETIVPYPENYEETVRQGKAEVRKKFMPNIKEMNKDISNYDVIAVGSPTWWYTMAPAVLTFLNKNDFEGKVMIPFMTNAGWPGHILKDMKKAASKANVMLPLEIKFDSDGGNNLETSEEEIDLWIEKIRKFLND